MSYPITVKLRDKLVAHCPEWIPNTERIHYSRENVVDNDIVVYTNRNFNEFFPKARLNIAILMESIEMDHEYYKYIYNYSNKYDIIFTWCKALLDLNRPNIKLYLCGTTWLHPNYRQIYTKKKMCSTIMSNNNRLSGHIMRHDIARAITNKPMNIDIYGSKFRNLPISNSTNPQSLSNGKILALRDYMFSITVENCKIDYEFTEKLIDCFLSGTVPIYWGCPSIGNFFNVNGMLIFDTIEELMNIIGDLSADKYNNMMPYVIENFNTAKKYTDFKLNEEEILKKL